MNRKTRQRGILIAVVVGTVSLLFSWIGPLAAARKATRIVVAAQSLAAGTVIAAADLRVATYPGPAPAGYLTSPGAAVRHVLAHDVVAGQPILASDLAAHGARQGLSVGEVGVYIPVTLASAGGARPGDVVDVIWAGGNAASGEATKAIAPGTVLVRGARVIAVVTANNTPVQTGSAQGQTVGGYGTTVPAAVELAVPSALAGNLAAAAASGTVWLAVDPWAEPEAGAGPFSVPPGTSVVVPRPPTGQSGGGTAPSTGQTQPTTGQTAPQRAG